MPADIVTLEDCASNYGVFLVRGSTGTLYRVELNGSEGPASCPCESFRWAPQDAKECKHISELWNGGACLYNPQWKDGTAAPKYRPESYTYTAFSETPCPACGGLMVYVRRAV